MEIVSFTSLALRHPAGHLGTVLAKHQVSHSYETEGHVGRRVRASEHCASSASMRNTTY